ncbi:hypothetical protein ACFL1X_03845 [Candidatus Hydrogenedentota bacterium]
MKRLLAVVIILGTVTCWQSQLYARDVFAQDLQCEIISKGIPNPISLRLKNLGKTTYEYYDFMSKHATMPPMSNVRIEFRDRATGQVKAHVPAIATRECKRKKHRLEPGESTEILVYHRAFNEAWQSPGDYDVTVMFFNDRDAKQEHPVAVSQTLHVSVPTPDERIDLAELSGVFHRGRKTVQPYYLTLDGSEERCYLRGESLRDLKEGTRISVRGMLRSYLFEHTPGPSAPPPFDKGWVIYLQVYKLDVIDRPFGAPSGGVKPGDSRTGTKLSRELSEQPITTELKIEKEHHAANEPIIVDVYVQNMTRQAIRRNQFSPISSSVGLPDFVLRRVPEGKEFAIPPGLFGEGVEDWDKWYQPASGNAAFSVGDFSLPPGKRVHLLNGDLRLTIVNAREHCHRALAEKILLKRPENATTKKSYENIVSFADDFLKGGTFDVFVRAYSDSETFRIQISTE